MTNPNTPTKADEAASETCSVFDKIRADVDAEDFGVSVEFAHRAENYARYCVSRALHDAAPSPADRAASAQQAESPGYQRGYDDAIAACAALGWKTTDRAASAGAVGRQPCHTNVQLAYGYLWHINEEPMAPVLMLSSAQAANKARHYLLGLMTKDEQKTAIEAVRGLLGAGHE
jgi:hypothetical protein